MEGWRDGGMEGGRDGGMEGGREGWREGGREGGRKGGKEEGREGVREGRPPLESRLFRFALTVCILHSQRGLTNNMFSQLHPRCVQ